MKNNQKGFADIVAVFSSTMVIVLSIMVLGYTYEGPSYGTHDTIGRAGFVSFVTDIDCVRTAFITENTTNLMGEQMAANNSISEAQAFNYLAKGGITSLISEEDRDRTWLSRAQANAIPCTRIEKNNQI